MILASAPMAAFASDDPFPVTETPGSNSPNGTSACPISQTITGTTKSYGWMATNFVSAFLSAPGNISVSETRTVTTQAELTVSYNGTIDAVVLQVGSQTGVSLAASVAKSQAWSYQKAFGGTTAQRFVLSKRGWGIATRVVDNRADCTNVTRNGTLFAARPDNTVSEYCFHLDGYPASKFETTDGGCVDQG